MVGRSRGSRVLLAEIWYLAVEVETKFTPYVAEPKGRYVLLFITKLTARVTAEPRILLYF